MLYSGYNYFVEQNFCELLKIWIFELVVSQFAIPTISLGAKWSYAPCLELSIGFFSPALPSTTSFITVMVEIGAAINRGSTDFGRIE